MNRALWKTVNASLDLAFEAAAKERPNRQEFVPDPIGGLTEPAWVLFERKAMWVATNVWRATNGLTALDETAIERVERMACGHVDYRSKFVLYCTELAMGITEPRP